MVLVGAGPLGTRRADSREVTETFALLGRRTGILELVGERDGELLFAFTHTAFREYLAASYLVGKSRVSVDDPDHTATPRDLGWAARALAAHRDDPSWASVLTAVIEPGIQRHGQAYREDLMTPAAFDPILVAQIQSHRYRPVTR